MKGNWTCYMLAGLLAVANVAWADAQTGLVAPIGTPETIIDKASGDLRKVTLDPELQRKLAPLGSYTNPMSAAETTAFVHKQQQTWQPILDEIAKNQR